MMAIRNKHHAASPAAASAYLVRHGYINVRGHWVRGVNDCATTQQLPSGRVLIQEGRAV